MTTRIMEIRIDAILTGKAVVFGANGQKSAIHKTEREKPVYLDAYGFEGDQQADQKHHGGLDKAVHHYAFDHYPYWRNALQCQGWPLTCPGAFGENISTDGMTETTCHIGDIYRVGQALLQVSQGRQPCGKLNIRFDRTDMARLLQTSGKTGWYYRVLEPGLVAAGDYISLMERPCPDWTLSRLLHYLYIDPLNKEALKQIAEIPQLTESWRRLAIKRLNTKRVEDWIERLGIKL